MSRTIDLLKERYLSHMKVAPKLFIGIELEFPIVEKNGQATDIAVSQALLKSLPRLLDFEVEKYDTDGNPIQLVSRVNEDRILFEVSYTTLEFAFAKAEKISEVEERFNAYLEVIQTFLSPHQHEIRGCGVHPNWDENSNQPVRSPRYHMLMDYLALSRVQQSGTFHPFPQYGAFICGSQVQLDVSRQNFVRVINAFNQIEAAKAYLFANSEFSGCQWGTRISRDIFWEESMHGVFPANVGVNPCDFKDEEDFFAYLAKTAIFTAERHGKTLYFEPILAEEYLTRKEIRAYTLEKESVVIEPKECDFEQHRSYQYQDLTKRGTVEFRSVCTQPLDRTFAPAAFHLGLFSNLEKVEQYLKSAPFFQKEGRDYKQLRRKFSQKSLSEGELSLVRQFAGDLLNLAKEGLEKRANGEERYLDSLL